MIKLVNLEPKDKEDAVDGKILSAKRTGGRKLVKACVRIEDTDRSLHVVWVVEENQTRRLRRVTACDCAPPEMIAIPAEFSDDLANALTRL